MCDSPIRFSVIIHLTGRGQIKEMTKWWDNWTSFQYHPMFINMLGESWLDRMNFSRIVLWSLGSDRISMTNRLLCPSSRHWCRVHQSNKQDCCPASAISIYMAYAFSCSYKPVWKKGINHERCRSGDAEWIEDFICI